MGDMIRCSRCSTHHYRNDPCPDALFIQRRQVKDTDIGELVTYVVRGIGDIKHGTIASFNSTYVFVDFGTGTNKAVSPCDLLWGHKFGGEI